MNQDTTKAFLAGVLIPSIAYFFLLRRQQQKLENELRRREEEEEDDDDLFEDVEDDDDDGDGDEGISDDQNELADHSLLSKATKPSEWTRRDGPYKMLLIINMELQMGKGKIAAQCGHAAIGVYEKCLKTCPNALQAWFYTGCAKIALKCKNTSELLELMVLAKQTYRIPYYLVEDAGKTQIAAGSRTVLGLFAPTSFFEKNNYTSDLKLL